MGSASGGKDGFEHFLMIGKRGKRGGERIGSGVWIPLELDRNSQSCPHLKIKAHSFPDGFERRAMSESLSKYGRNYQSHLASGRAEGSSVTSLLTTRNVGRGIHSFLKARPKKFLQTRESVCVSFLKDPFFAIYKQSKFCFELGFEMVVDMRIRHYGSPCSHCRLEFVGHHEFQTGIASEHRERERGGFDLNHH